MVSPEQQDQQSVPDSHRPTTANVPVHTFDPAASPAEKAAAAGKARDKLQPIHIPDDAPPAREVPVDTGATKVVPTIRIDDADADKKEPSEAAAAAPQTPVSPVSPVSPVDTEPPGAFDQPAASTIPDWYRVGWRQMAGIDEAPANESEAKDKDVLAMFLSEQYYGDWYHNAGIIIFAVLATHFLTRFKFGWGWLLIVLAVCATYYKTSIERVRRRARDDIQRELVKTRLASEHESADWMNNFLDRFWRIYEPVLSSTVISSVDQIFSANTPPFLDSLRLTEFTLGTKAPHIDQVRTFPKTEEDVVMMDWGISFTPNDVSDLTPRQLRFKVNPKIVLTIRLGKGLATASMPVLVEDINFSGLMRIRLKLITNFPHIQIVDFCFLEKPVIDYVLKPIGGETFGFDIANIPGLSSFIRDMTHGTLGPMMYDPNVFTLNLEQMLSGKPLDAAIGVLQVTIHSARGIKGSKIGGGTPDPYVTLTINDRVELARTMWKQNTYNPTWVETKFLLVHSLHDQLMFNLWDYNKHQKDNMMSQATFELSRLLEDASQEDIREPFLKDGKDRGELRFDATFYPVLEEKEASAQSSVGIVRVTIHQAKDLDNSKSLSGDLNPLAKLYVGNMKTPAFTTRCFKHTNAPIWEAAHEYICADKNSSMIMIKVIDDRDFLKDPVIGYMSIKLPDLLDCMGEAGRDWFPLSSCKSGKIRVSAEWKPLSIAGSLQGADQYRPPIGVVRLVLDKATDVKNVEGTLGGKSDPYVRVQVNNVTKGRTEVVNNNLNPVWDQIVYVPVHSLKETLMLEVMDYQHLTRDRSLGSVELLVSDLAKESDDPHHPYQSTGLKTAMEDIRLDGGSFKGQLHYTASFIATLAFKIPEFSIQENSVTAAVQAKRRSTSSGGGFDTSTSASSDDELVPIAPTIKMPKKRENGEAQHVKSDSVTTATTDVSAHTAETSDEKTDKPQDAEQSPVEQPAATTDKEEKEGAKEIAELTPEEALGHQSGVIICNVKSGKIAKKARLEVLLDEGYWPCFSTFKAPSTRATWEYIGEGFVKEIDFSHIYLRLNEAPEGEKDDIVGEWKGETKDFLKATLTGPQQFVLTDQDDRYTSTVTVEARYVPVPVVLEPKETVNNQGLMRVDLLSGHNILGVDRTGKSDPFAVFYLNGNKVFKSEVKKKTLDPEWNENFTISIPSRVAADFFVEIFDWNQIEQAKSLGTASIDVNDIEPFAATERALRLSSEKHGDKGEVRVRMVFTPEIIAKTRKPTSTFTTAGRAMTQIGGLPVSAGKGVFHGVAGVFKRGDRDRDQEENEPERTEREVPAGQASQPVGASEHVIARDMAFPTKAAADAAPQEPGTLRVTVLNAKDLTSSDSKPYALIRVGDKEFKTKHVGKTASPEWNESFLFSAGSTTPKLHAWIHDHKTLGKDKVLGEGEIDIWRHIQPGSNPAADVFVELRQGGLLRLRLDFDASATHSGSAVSLSSERITRTISLTSPPRFSIRGRRPAEHEE